MGTRTTIFAIFLVIVCTVRNMLIDHLDGKETYISQSKEYFKSTKRMIKLISGKIKRKGAKKEKIEENKKVVAGTLAAIMFLNTILLANAEEGNKNKNYNSGWIVDDLNECVDLTTYDRDEITAEAEKIAKETLEQNVNAILINYPEYKIKSQDRVKQGDYVDISIKGIENGKHDPFLAVDNLIVKVGDGSLPPELENIIPGRKPGKQVTVQIASDNFNYNINEDTIKIYMMVNAIVDAKFYTCNTLNEKYVTETLGCESVEDFYNRLTNEMGDTYNQTSIINELLIKKYSVTYPDILVAQFADQRRQLIINQVFDGNIEKYRSTIGEISLQAYENSIYEYYKENLTTMLLYLGIAIKEDIKPSGKMYDQYISAIMESEDITSEQELFAMYDTTYETGEEYLQRQYLIDNIAESFARKDLIYDTVTIQPSSEWYTEYPVPQNSGFKSFMDYRKITSRSSNQYRLQQAATTSYNGIRMVDGRYCMALGTYFGTKVGQYFDLVLENGTRINCITGDIKSDKDTDYYNIFTPNGCCSEFIIDSEYLPKNIMLTGNMSNLYPQWNSSVSSIYVYDEYATL